MLRRKCISCGFFIFKSGLNDPYICRDCENRGLGENARYAYLDGI